MHKCRMPFAGFDGIADTIDEARDISNVLRPEAASEYQSQFRDVADPQVEPTVVPEISPEAATGGPVVADPTTTR